MNRRTPYYLPRIAFLFLLMLPFFQAKTYSQEPSSSLFEKGIEALQKGDLKTAETHFRAVLKEEPENPFAYFSLGTIFLATRRIDLALVALNRAVEFKPDLVAAHLRLAEIYEGQGQLDEALREYEEAYLYTSDETGPEGEIILARLENLERAIFLKGRWDQGIVLLRGGNYLEAEEAFREILSIQPRNAQAHHYLGIVLGIQNRFDESIESFKESLRLKPDLNDSRTRLAELYQLRGALLEARSELEKAIFFQEEKEGPEFEFLERRLSSIDDQIEIRSLLDRSAQEIESKNIDAAMVTLQEVIQRDPKNPLAYFNLGNLSAQNNRFDLAESHFKKAIEIEPEYIEAYQRLGQVYELLRFFGRAKIEYEKAALTARGKIDLLRKELQRLIAHTEGGMEQAKIASRAAYDAVQKALQENDIDKAISSLEQAVFLNPEDSQHHFQLGQLYERKDQIDLAINQMRGALEFNPRLVDAYQFLGFLYERKGYLYQALRAWKKADSILASDQNKGEIGQLEKKRAELEIKTAPLIEKGKKEAEEGKRMAAIETLEKALLFALDDVRIRMELGSLYVMTGAAAEAVSQFNTILLLEPTHGEAHTRLGLLYSSAGQWREAQREYEAALRSEVISDALRSKAQTELGRVAVKLRNEQDARRYFNRGSRYLAQQDYLAAIEAFEKVIRLYPKHVQSLYLIGTSYEGMNNSEEASRYYEEVLSLNPMHIPARQQLGFVHEREGKNERAIQIYRETLDLLGGSGSPEAVWIKNRLEPLEKRLHVSINQVVLGYESNPFQTAGSSGSTLRSNLNLTMTYDLKKDRRFHIPIELTTNNVFYFRLNTLFSSETFSVKLASLQQPYSYAIGYKAILGISDSGGTTGLNNVGFVNVERSLTASRFAGLEYIYDNFSSFQREGEGAVRQNVRVYLTQGWNINTLNISYSYWKNAHERNDQAYQSHGVGLVYARNLTENIRGVISYTLDWKEFSNPDSFIKRTEERSVFRRNFLHQLSFNAIYSLRENLSVGVNYIELWNFSNLPVAPSDRVAPEERLSGQEESLGDYSQRIISFSFNWSF